MQLYCECYRLNLYLKSLDFKIECGANIKLKNQSRVIFFYSEMKHYESMLEAVWQCDQIGRFLDFGPLFKAFFSN